MNALNCLALFVASCFLGALPPVLLRAVCFVRAMLTEEQVNALLRACRDSLQRNRSCPLYL
jgi:hypothetical protein